jgi:glycosyltransferase involved in cell wall biosynthesis
MIKNDQINFAENDFESQGIDVSIVIATMDRAVLLDRMLASVPGAASGIKYEIIVIHGPSKDNTAEVLKKHKVDAVYEEATNLGPGKHSWPELYNFGFSVAKGRWSMYASDDIIFCPDCLTNAVNYLKGSRDENIAGGIFFYKNTLAEEGWDSFGIDFTSGQKLLCNYGLIDTNVYRQVGGLDAAYKFYCADTDLCCRLYSSGKILVPLAGSKVVHNNVLDRQKQSNLAESKNDIELCKKRWKDFVGTERPDPRRLIWQENFVEAYNISSEMANVPAAIDHFWHGLGLLAYSGYDRARQAFLRAIDGRCDHWLILWLTAQSAFHSGHKGLALKAASAVCKLNPRFEPAKEFAQKLTAVAQSKKAHINASQIDTGENDERKQEACQEPTRLAGSKTVLLAFSKDRAMQLEAALRSFYSCCSDSGSVDVKVIYAVSDKINQRHYAQLRGEYIGVSFIEEGDFKSDVLDAVDGYEYVLFMVDDNIFVRDFSVGSIRNALCSTPAAIGFSLRLGENIVHHYSRYKPQTVPQLVPVEGQICKYDWTRAEGCFRYPLEVSSSLYRIKDIIELLRSAEYNNPNTFEAALSENISQFVRNNELLCFRKSAAFCNPVNIVQDVCKNNRHGDKPQYTASNLDSLFGGGYRIDVDKFRGFTPISCHQEVDYNFIDIGSITRVKATGEQACVMDRPQGAGEFSGAGQNEAGNQSERYKSTGDSRKPPKLSIIMPVYNSEKYLPETLDSILAQDFEDYEIVISDDQSTDRSLQISRAYARNDSRLKVIALPHLGNTLSRVSALLNTDNRSQYIMNHDSDDISLPGKLSKLVKYLDSHPEISIAGTFAEYFDDDGNDRGKPKLESAPERIAMTFHQLNSMINSASMYRRSVLDSIGPYDSSYPAASDYEFFARALMAGHKLKNIPEVLHKIRIHDRSVGSVNSNVQQEYADKVRRKYSEFLFSKINKRKRSTASETDLKNIQIDQIESNIQSISETDKRKLNILQTVEFYYPHIGGAESVVQQISERLAARGHNVTVATTYLPERKFDELNGVKVCQFHVRGNFAHAFQGSDIEAYQQFLLEGDFDIMSNYAAQQWATDLAFLVMDQLRERRVNIISPCGYSALADSRTIQYPQYTDYFNKVLPRVLKLYDAAVYHSSRYQDYEYAQNLGLKNSLVIPNGFAAEEFDCLPNVNFRRKYDITTPFMGLCVANFIAGKGHDRLIEAIRQLNRNDFTLVFVGREGNCFEQLKAQSQNLNIRFCVDIPREDTLAAYHQADMFLLGSYKEASPLVIIEAMATSTPFISTPCGNVTDWPGGAVCEPEDIASNINRLLEDESYRKSLGQQGRQYSREKLTWQRIADHYEELYIKLYNAKSEIMNPSALKEVTT